MERNLKIEYVDVNELQFADYNPRKASEKQFEELKANIESFGFVDPILVNSHPSRKNIIIGGHFRVKVAKALGYKVVPVVYIEIEDVNKEKELNVRLNKNTGSFDYEILANVFEVEDLTNWGFSLDELGLGGNAPDSNFGIDLDTKSEHSVITLKFDNEKYLEMLDLIKQAKQGLGFETTEDLFESLLKDNV